MHLRLAADLFLRSAVAVAVATGVASALVDEGLLQREQPNRRVAVTEFGTWSDTGAFTTTRDIPLRADQTFGWRIVVPDGQPVLWREELVLPAAPAQWSGAHFVEIRDDGRVAVTAGVDVPWEGVVEHAWAITPGDPAGEYELRLWLDGELHQTFHFFVE